MDRLLGVILVLFLIILIIVGVGSLLLEYREQELRYNSSCMAQEEGYRTPL